MKNNIIIIAIIDGKCFFESIWMFPKIGGTKTPKWMVYFMENHQTNMDDLGGFPIFLG